ncbi:predicted protein [Nematostella vectensis]|uniref:WW domain-binding protein 4 n=1 Tax=Nematostella vectensis TaxID=45351 RepID=A7S772_NEMVE|nr:predicted protein [Nematostella vectensis]|eukprot:XP_001632544.1 predicted protein [Nematostella vectensis]
MYDTVKTRVKRNKRLGALWAEYWRSQPKKFCDFCKCWITDNKPSVEFHERGKKHQENVQLKITAVRKKGIQSLKKDQEFQHDMAAIEAAALAAYKKDLGIEDTEEEKPSKAKPDHQSEKRPQFDIRGAVNREPASQDPPACHDPPASSSSPSCSIVYNGSQPVVHCTHSWAVSQSPEGYYYYYNSQTQASQWEVPNCLQPEESNDSSGGKKDAVSKSEDLEGEASSKEPTVVKPSPYGSWTTVRVIEPPQTTPQSDTVKEDQEQTEDSEDPEETAKKTEKKFREKQTPVLRMGTSSDADVVAFKKRKLNSERKRNIRTTKFDS